MPPGSMLLSKNPDLFLKGKSPAYFHKAKGCYIWDLDSKRYLDFSFIEYEYKCLRIRKSKVNNAISKAIKNGSCSTLNSREDVLLAQKIIDLPLVWCSSFWSRALKQTLLLQGYQGL